MITLGNIGGAFKAGHYVHAPGWGESGHSTIAQLYRAILLGVGMPDNNFGRPDMSLPGSIVQNGPLS